MNEKARKGAPKRLRKPRKRSAFVELAGVNEQVAIRRDAVLSVARFGRASPQVRITLLNGKVFEIFDSFETVLAEFDS